MAEKALGCVHIVVSAQEEIHRLSRLVHSPIQVDPPAPHLYIGLVHSPGSPNRTIIATPALLEFRQVMLDPAHNRGVRQRDASVRHHDHQISQTQLEAGIPLTQRTMICPSKCRPLNSASIGPKGRILPSSATGSVCTRTMRRTCAKLCRESG